jgi:hypothetical protein
LENLFKSNPYLHGYLNLYSLHHIVHPWLKISKGGQDDENIIYIYLNITTNIGLNSNKFSNYSEDENLDEKE